MSDRTIDGLWQEVLDHWDNEAAHTAFVSHCHQKQALAEAARRYSALRGDESRRDLVQKKLEGIAFLATSAMLAGRTPARRGPPRWLVLLVLATLGTLAFYSLFVALR